MYSLGTCIHAFIGPTPICSSLRSVINILAAGKAPSSVSWFLAGRSLIAPNKNKEGCAPDIRPIAVGETLQRLVGKCMCALLKVKTADFSGIDIYVFQWKPRSPINYVCRCSTNISVDPMHACSDLFQSPLGIQVEVGNDLTADHSHTHPADLLLINWTTGKTAAFDIYLSSQHTYSDRSGMFAGSAALATEGRKHRVIDEKCKNLAGCVFTW